MKRLSLLSILGAIVCLASIPVHAQTTHWIAVQSTSLFNSGPHSVATTDGTTIDAISPALTLAAWKDQAASQSSTFSKWSWQVGVNSGTGNGALLDGNESMTLQLGQNWGVGQLRFMYSSAGTTISVSGFLSNPIATSQPYGAPDIGTMSYSSGTLSIPITVSDTGGNEAIVNLANLYASAGDTLEVTVSAGGYTALNQVTYTTVPEPTSLGLLGLGAMMLFGLGRKQRS